MSTTTETTTVINITKKAAAAHILTGEAAVTADELKISSSLELNTVAENFSVSVITLLQDCYRKQLTKKELKADKILSGGYKSWKGTKHDEKFKVVNTVQATVFYHTVTKPANAKKTAEKAAEKEAIQEAEKTMTAAEVKSSRKQRKQQQEKSKQPTLSEVIQVIKNSDTINIDDSKLIISLILQKTADIDGLMKQLKFKPIKATAAEKKATAAAAAAEKTTAIEAAKKAMSEAQAM